MSDSVSRYSIVERLSMEKLRIMSTKHEIVSSIEKKKVSLKQMRVQIKEKEQELKQQMNAEMATFNADIEKLEREITMEEKGKSTKARLCEEQIAEIGKALTAIAEISRSSVEEAKK